MKREVPDITQYLEHLRSIPFVQGVGIEPVDCDEATAPDGRLTIETAGGPRSLAFQVRRSHLVREIAESIAHRARDTKDLLVMAPHIGREIGALFRSEKINYVDLSGNWYLNLDDQYVAHAQGRSKEKSPAREKGLRAAAYRALFSILVDPELIGAPTRRIAEHAGKLSPQTVNDLRNGLLERGLVLRTRGTYRWTPGRKREALDLWLAGFATTLWSHLKVGSYRSRFEEPEALERELLPLLESIGGWRWGGGAAADRLTDYYRGPTTLIYFQDPPPPDIARRLRLVPDTRGNVTLARAPGLVAFRGPRTDTVHPLLVYADLLLEGRDRTSEAARVLREKELGTLERDT